MDYDVFPHVKKQQLDQWLEEENRIINQKYENSLREKTDLAKKEEKNWENKGKNIGIAISIGIGLAFFIWLSSHIGTGLEGLLDVVFAGFLSALFLALWIKVIFPILLWGIGALGQILGYNKSNKSLSATVEEINKHYNNELTKATNTVEEQFNNYEDGFFEAVDKVKPQFTESSSTVSLSEYLLDYGFGPIIKSADRRPSIERIEVLYSINVYKDRVAFDSIKNGAIVENGSYVSFNENRIEDLPSPVEQTALAQALAANIIILVAEKFGTDLSGTASMVKVDYEYGMDFARAILTYVAPNGNFTAKKSW